ncbi:MAG: DUF2490 domain-containing protein [Candidatus Margulisiibacteriota bacterium]
MARKCVLLLLLVFGLVWGRASADSEFWLAPTLQKPIKEGLAINLIPEIRVRNNLSDLYYLRLYLGPAFQLNKNWGLNVYYAPNYVKSGSYWTSLYYLDAVYNLPLPWLVFNNRARFEYDATPQVLKYRDQFLFSRNGWFAADELFYNLNRGYFDEGRSFIGYTFKVRDKIDLSLGYLWRRQKASPAADWVRTGAFNVGAKIVY